MSNLSSETLFHFTSSLGRLKSILKDGLWYSLFGEKVPGTKKAYFVRAISFCNIPLSMISEHVDWYGKYAIGLKRSALREKGATPVIYAHSQSPFLEKVTLENNPYLCYMKQLIGMQKHKAPDDEKYHRKKFYDEKEWRISKGMYEIDGVSSLKDLDEKKLSYDKTIKTIPPLILSPDMIEYIILDNRKEYGDFFSFITSNEDLKKYRGEYLSKILYYSQIKKDF